jgi:hypothetical protein
MNFSRPYCFSYPMGYTAEHTLEYSVLTTRVSLFVLYEIRLPLNGFI